jgi:hypothetical protein
MTTPSPPTTPPDERPPKTVVQQVLGQWPLASVLAGVSIGLVIVFLSHWRAGSTLVGLSITAGGLLRLLPQQRVGLLAVRNRALDSIVLLGVGIGITILAWWIPPSR